MLWPLASDILSIAIIGVAVVIGGMILAIVCGEIRSAREARREHRLRWGATRELRAVSRRLVKEED